MDIIYADSLFLLNAVIDYLLLLATGKICALPLRRWRMALAAALGGLYAPAAVILPEYFALATVKLLVGAALVMTAYGAGRQLPRCVLCFFALSAAFAGAIYAAAGLGGYPRGGQLYIPVSLKMLVLSFAVFYALTGLVFRHMGRRGERSIHGVELTFMGRSVRFAALHDSGNELRDPLSGDPVMIIQRSAVEPLFHLPEGDSLSAMQTLSALPGCAGKFRILPCGSIAGSDTLLICFRPDSVSIDGRETTRLLAAVSPARLSPDGDYQALINIS